MPFPQSRRMRDSEQAIIPPITQDTLSIQTWSTPRLRDHGLVEGQVASPFFANRVYFRILEKILSVLTYFSNGLPVHNFFQII